MRYITPHANYVVSKRNGDPLYKFGPSGVLVVGSLTTAIGAGNSMTQTYDSDEVGNNAISLFPTGLDGTTNTPPVECWGQGSLDGLDADGSSLTYVTDGYRGKFFPSPIITLTASSTDSVSATANIWYEVLLGKVTYDGVTYKKGEIFKTDGAERDAVSVGTSAQIALTLPPALQNRAIYDRDGDFHNKNLGHGDEPYDYYDFSSGYEPRSSITNSDADFFGYVR
jgi:hypothetical protein